MAGDERTVAPAFVADREGRLEIQEAAELRHLTGSRTAPLVLEDQVDQQAGAEDEGREETRGDARRRPGRQRAADRPPGQNQDRQNDGRPAQDVDRQLHRAGETGSGAGEARAFLVEPAGDPQVQAGQEGEDEREGQRAADENRARAQGLPNGGRKTVRVTHLPLE